MTSCNLENFLPKTSQIAIAQKSTADSLVFNQSQFLERLPKSIQALTKNWGVFWAVAIWSVVPFPIYLDIFSFSRRKQKTKSTTWLLLVWIKERKIFLNTYKTLSNLGWWHNCFCFKLIWEDWRFLCFLGFNFFLIVENGIPVEKPQNQSSR